MKKLSTILVFCITILSANGQSIRPSEATEIAQNFFAQRLAQHQHQQSQEVTVLNQMEVSQDGATNIFAVNFNPEGFVLVSASHKAYPVLAYSLTGSFTDHNQPESFKAWVRYFGRQIEWAESTLMADPAISEAWEQLSDPNIPARTMNQSRFVEPMLRTTWDQGNYYNAACPADAAGPGGHCWAGCVATAVGQLMMYHRWPNQGTGEYSYMHPDYGEQYANFGETTYNWNGMEIALSGPNNDVALLLNHLGVSFDMDYGPDGSGMWNHSAARSMRDYFKYGPETQYIFRDSTNLNWDSILIVNLDAGKPLYYAGWEGVGSESGHAFVCDGYAPDNFYHFNWGWSNSYDGYFLLSALTPGGNNFNFAQEVIKDIYPDTLLYNYPEYCSGPDTLRSMAGTFSDGSNMVNYLNNSDCFWLIQPNDPDFDSITSINLDFPLVDLAGTDRIRVYQGADTTAAIIAELTGTQTPPTISIPGGTFLVRFNSDASETGNGFLGAFKSVLPVYCSGTTTITDSSGTLDDGSGDKRYGNNSICKYKIIPENLVPTTLTFEAFSTEPDVDVLRIYDLSTQQLIATYSGDTIPAPLTIQSGKAYLVFMTNKEITGEGWTVNWAPEETTGTFLYEKMPGKIYPNPVDHQLWLETDIVDGKAIAMQVYSASGKLILQREITSSEGKNPVMIDTRSLEKGFYLLRVISHESTATYSFIKM